MNSFACYQRYEFCNYILHFVNNINNIKLFSTFLTVERSVLVEIHVEQNYLSEMSRCKSPSFLSLLLFLQRQLHIYQDLLSSSSSVRFSSDSNHD